MTDIDDHLQPLVATTYRALADLLAQSSPSGWETQSLCAGWRIREVVAHMTMPVRYDEAAFMAELKECDFDFTRLSDRIADHDGGLPTDSLVEQLRSEPLHIWTPPGSGSIGALNHVVVHSLDVTVPLGQPGCAPEAAMIAVLDDLTGGGAHHHFGTDLGGRRLESTESIGPSGPAKP